MSCPLFLQVHETLFQRIFISTIFWKVRQRQRWTRDSQKIKRQHSYLFESSLFIISALTHLLPICFICLSLHVNFVSWKDKKKIMHQKIPLTTYSDALQGKRYINVICTRWISPCFSLPDLKNIRFITFLLMLPFSACWFFFNIFEHVTVS